MNKRINIGVSFVGRITLNVSFGVRANKLFATLFGKLVEFAPLPSVQVNRLVAWPKPTAPSSVMAPAVGQQSTKQFLSSSQKPEIFNVFCFSKTNQICI